MKEYGEYRILVGFDRSSKKIFDELEQIIAKYKRGGWSVETVTIDDSLEFIDVIFYREVTI